MNGEIIDVAGRSADQIAIEICTIRDQVATTAMVGACQIGKRLEEAKRLVAFGDWGDYIKNRIGYSQSQVDNLMRLYREYGEFGPNSQSIANLSPTAALKLLALPADERESFAESHDVAAMSVRKLEAEIKAHKERADQAAEDALAQKELLALATEENGALKQKLDGIDADYKAQLDTVDRENDELRAKLDSAQRAEKQAKADLAELKKNPKITDAVADRYRDEGRQQVQTDCNARLEAAQEKVTAAEASRMDMEKALVEARRELETLKNQRPAEPSVLADPDAAAFNIHLAQVGETVNKMLGHYMKARARNPEVSAKMVKAMRALCGRLDEAVKKLEG